MSLNFFNKISLNSKAVLVIVFVIITSVSYAKDRNKTVILTKNSAANNLIDVSGNTLDASNSFLFIYNENLTTAPNVVLNRKTSLELSVNDFIPPFYWYDLEYKFKITPIKYDNTHLPQIGVTLKVSNNHYGGFGNFVDLNKYVINNNDCIGFIIEVDSFTILNKDTGLYETTLPNNVVLKLNHTEESYFSLANTTASLNPAAVVNASNKTVNFTWSTIPEAEEYELEWTWIDNYASTGLTDQLAENLIKLTNRDFELNNTRVRLNSTSYTIPLVYDRGYIICRVRAIGRFIDNSSPSNAVAASKISYYGAWSCDESAVYQTVADWCDTKLLIDAHDNEKNWQYQATYAENGKKKDVVSYFDGTLRNRQTVTKTNTNEKAIIGEVIYDEEGRPAIEVLPSPTNFSALQYYPNFNRSNESLAAYSYQDFSSFTALACSFLSGGMSKDYGASKYFSDNNTVGNNYQDFVPDAELFPFSQTQYTPDNTGRIAKKGGVGNAFQFGRDHETKYYYSTPTPEELNRLFGYYVGYANHYKKNVVIDPNKQVSISYIDPQGKTIATALGAKVPDNMIALDESTGDFSQNDLDLLNKVHTGDTDTFVDNNNRYSNNYGNLFDGLRYDSQKTNTNENTVYTFDYHLNIPNSYHFACETANSTLELNYPYVYKLNIDFKDQCGNLLDGISDFQVGYYNLTQLTVPLATPTSYAHDFNITPPIGSFGISKRLVVDQAALELFADDFINKAKESGCILSPQDPNVDISGCSQSCEECAAHYNQMTFTNSTGQHFLGLQAYVNQMLASNYDLNQLPPGNDYNNLHLLLQTRYEQEFAMLLEECQRPCQIPGLIQGTNNGQIIESVSCSNSIGQIMADMLPSGQYGVVTSDIGEDGGVTIPASTTTDISSMPLSIYNENNELFVYAAGVRPNEKSWRFPFYYNKDGFDIDFDNNGTTNDEYKHYFNESGEIEYVPIVWDEDNNTFVPPLIPSLNTPALLHGQFPNSLVEAASGSYKAEPQYLGNVTDFIELINEKEYWTLSLVIYHPEFHYLDYQYGYCSPVYNMTFTDLNINQAVPGNETVTYNSDGFDQLLNIIQTYQDAKAAGLLANVLTLFTHDPFFQQKHPHDGEVVRQGTLPSDPLINFYDPFAVPELEVSYRDAKKSIMLQALNKTSSDAIYNGNDSNGYDGTGKIMIEAVYDIVACNGPGFDCVVPLPTTSANPFQAVLDIMENITTANNTFSDEDRNRFWKYYKSYYLTLKQKIQHTFINLHAIRQGTYNDCIGNEDPQNYNTITSVISDYSVERGQIENWKNNNGNFPHVPVNGVVDNLCNHITSDPTVDMSQLLVNYEKRFLPYDALYDSEQSGAHILSSLSSAANTNYYQETGTCTLVRDLQLFLAEAVKRSSMIPVLNGSTISSTNQPLFNFITPDLLAAIGGNYYQGGFTVNTSSITNTSLGSTVTLNLSQSAIMPAPFTLTVPSSVGYSWSNYGTSAGNWSIVDMGQIVSDGPDTNTPPNYHFRIIAKIKNPDGTIVEKILKGTTKAVLACGFTPQGEGTMIDLGSSLDCDVKKNFANALIGLIVSLQNAGTVDVTNVSLMSNPAFTSSMLYHYFDIHAGDTVTWSKTVNYVYTIAINNHVRFEFNSSFDLQAGQFQSMTIGTFLSEPLNYPWAHSFTAVVNTAEYGAYSIEGSISNGNKIPLLLSCCNPCGDIDADGDGIGDNGVFTAGNCDECDNRIDSNGDGVPDCECVAGGGCNPCEKRRVAFVFSNPFNPSDYTYNLNEEDADNLAKELMEFIENHNSTLEPTNRAFDYYGFDLTSSYESPASSARSLFIDNVYSLTGSQYVYSTSSDKKVNLTSGNGTSNIILRFNNDPGLGQIVPKINLALQNSASMSKTYDVVYYFIGNNSQISGTDVSAQNFVPLYNSQTGKGKRPFFVFFTDENDNINGMTQTPVAYLSSLLPILHSVNSSIPSTAIQYVDSATPSANANAVYISFKTRQLNSNSFFAVGLNSGLSTVLERIFASITFPVGVDTSCQISSIQRQNQRRLNKIDGGTDSCPCIPQVAKMATCDDAYNEFMSFMNTRFPGSTTTSLYVNPSPTSTLGKDEFCNSNLQYLVEGYEYYIEHLGITTTDMSVSHYIDIATFGATGLNYGYNYNDLGYTPVIDAYQNYLQTLEADAEVLPWASFVNNYLSSHPEICPPKAMTPVTPIVQVVSNCEVISQNLTETYNQDAFNAYIKTKRDEFIKGYLDHAIGDVVENFNMHYADKEYQYTLYYYDQAGNLIQTIAPQGVNRLPATLNTQINQLRDDNFTGVNNSLLPMQGFKTKYHYNSLNQLVWQSTPDGGVTRFAYDELGRIVASQNTKQLNLIIDLSPSIALGSELKTEEGYIENIRGGGDIRNCYGNSLQGISEYGYAEHTIRLNGRTLAESTGELIFGLSFKNYNNGTVDYGFYHDDSGSFKIIANEKKYDTSYAVSDGDILKVERIDGYVRFYQNDLLLREVVEKNEETLIVNFYLPRGKSRLSELKIGINKSPRDFSYTCYDKLGRIKEAGQFRAKQFLRIDDNGKLTYNTGVWVPVNSNDIAINYPLNVSDSQIEVTKTLYDTYDPFDPNDYLSNTIRNTRGRVTCILSFDTTDSTTLLQDNETAIFYNYDIHGNVDEMAERLSPNVMYIESQPDGVIKHVNYEYDLISGNVNKVIYQKGIAADQFIHKYNYDADNRITSVETSRDNEVWEKDATYEYYEHGPLARVITGDKKVQGTDFAYTLQGWIKTVNSENLASSHKDMGGDGNNVSKDAFGYSLSYFENDYKARLNTMHNLHFVSQNTGINGTSLFNGNINRMITSVRGLEEEIMPTQINLYRYDQLNRIFSMVTFNGKETSSAFTAVSSYKSNYTYYKNGNLKTLFANSPKLANPDDPESETLRDMDNFTYIYKPNNNQLTQITDTVDANEFTVDVDGQGVNNYVYNDIGQLITDTASHISNIDWRVDGKVKSINKDEGKQFINFFYDGLGNRVAKQVTRGKKGTTTTHYTRDAQGNVLGVYQLAVNNIVIGPTDGNELPPGQVEYKLLEHHIYGSSRLGLQTYDVPSASTTNYFQRLVGDKRFELSNHLGNVLSVINDRKIVNNKVKPILVDNFDNEEIGWHPLGEISLEVNKERALQLHVKDSVKDKTGIFETVNFDAEETVMFNMNVQRLENFPSAATLQFEVDDKFGNALWSTVVPEDGIVSGSFTPEVSAEYILKLLLTNPQKINAAFTFDNFYVFVAPNSPIDYVSLFKPDLVAYNDYYPFGSLVPNRHGSTDDYRYGFQGQEKDDEIKGEGNSLNYEFRMHDPRVGRFFARDPLEPNYPFFSPYQFNANSPIMSIELEGLEASNDPNQVQIPFTHNENSKPEFGPQNSIFAKSIQLEEIVLIAVRRCKVPSGSNFERYQEQVFKHEGGYVNDRRDPGGATNKGIIFKNFKVWAKSDLGIEPTLGNLKGLTNDQASLLYKKHYWDTFRGDEFENGSVSFAIYDWTVTSGGAIKFLEKKTSKLYDGITVDGKLSSSDVAALNKVDAKQLFDKVNETRLDYYNMLIDKAVAKYKKKHPNATEQELKDNTLKYALPSWKKRVKGMKFEPN